LVVGQRGHCNLIHHDSGFNADIYIAFDELHRWALAHRSRAASPSTHRVEHRHRTSCEASPSVLDQFRNIPELRLAITTNIINELVPPERLAVVTVGTAPTRRVRTAVFQIGSRLFQIYHVFRIVTVMCSYQSMGYFAFRRNRNC
jgi:hypothetical protein